MKIIRNNTNKKNFHKKKSYQIDNLSIQSVFNTKKIKIKENPII